MDIAITLEGMAGYMDLNLISIFSSEAKQNNYDHLIEDTVSDTKQTRYDHLAKPKEFP